MKAKMLKLSMICLFAGLVAGYAPMAVEAQVAAEQESILLIKIRSIDQLMRDVEKLMPPAQASKAGQQVAMLRGMLQGTDWIDPDRSIVGGMVVEGMKTNWVMMIPFRAANDGFQQSMNAVSGPDYYMMTFPPQPGLNINPAVEGLLSEASKSPAASNLVLEASAGRLLEMFEPQVTAMTRKLEPSPPPKSGQPAIAPQQIQTMISETFRTFRQVDILRLGLDLAGDIFTLQLDVEAMANTPLAGVLTDLGGTERLMGYQVDMPISFRSRAHNMFGILDLMRAAIGPIYQEMGIDIDDMEEMFRAFTGEMTGGMRVASEGLAWEMMAVLTPGINGEDFLQNTYMPWFEQYNKQISEALSKDTPRPEALLYERTEDSVVDGVMVVGMKANFDGVIPPDPQNANPFAGQSFEMRLAGVDDLLFIASNDSQLGRLMDRRHSLASAPAEGPTIEFDIDLGTFFRDIQSMIPAKGSSIPWPKDPGKLTMQSEMRDGKLLTRTSFNIVEMRELMLAISSQTASKAETPPAD